MGKSSLTSLDQFVADVALNFMVSSVEVTEGNVLRTLNLPVHRLAHTGRMRHILVRVEQQVEIT